MSIKKRYCASHADRPAIGICVITQQPICAECSTRYEGVNYSKEGLRIHIERRAGQSSTAKPARRGKVLAVVAWLVVPVLLALLFEFYHLFFEQCIDLMQAEIFS
jgi:hypothetical protein